VDGSGASSWPFAHFNMLTTRTNSNEDCLQAEGITGRDESGKKLSAVQLREKRGELGGKDFLLKKKKKCKQDLRTVVNLIANPAKRNCHKW
jgi:hypothetical protein